MLETGGVGDKIGMLIRVLTANIYFTLCLASAVLIQHPKDIINIANKMITNWRVAYIFIAT